MRNSDESFCWRTSVTLSSTRTAFNALFQRVITVKFSRFSFSLACASYFFASVPAFAQPNAQPTMSTQPAISVAKPTNETLSGEDTTARALAAGVMQAPLTTAISTDETATSVANASLAQRRSALMKAPSVALRGASTPRRLGVLNASLRQTPRFNATSNSAQNAKARNVGISNASASNASASSTNTTKKPLRLAAAPAVSDQVARDFAALTQSTQLANNTPLADRSSTRSATSSRSVTPTRGTPRREMIGLPPTSLPRATMANADSVAAATQNGASQNGALKNGISTSKPVVGSLMPRADKNVVSTKIVTKSETAARRDPAALSARHKDRLLLAQLEADLMRADRGLDKADATLGEGQKQLMKVGATLRSAMLDAGADAKGLHPFVRVAMRYAGTPYVWGGESRNGFDCSGFIIVVMRDLGYRALPHSAAEQFNYGTPIAQALLKPGDIVFFKNTYKPGVSHVGIYLGRRRFINAAGTGKGTIVSSLDDPHWQAHYAGARRLIRG